MRGLRTTLVVAVFVAAAVVLFNAYRPPGEAREDIVPLLQRRGQWPHRHLMGLTPERRMWVLGQVIESSGHRCDPRSSEFEGLREDLAAPVAYHYVGCGGDGAYLVALVADEQGSTRVLDCRKARARGLDCRRDWARMPPFPQ